VVLLTAADAGAWCRMTTSSAAPTPGSPCVTEGIPLEWNRRCMEYSIDARGSKDLTIDQVTEIVRSSFDAWLAVECADGMPPFEVRETMDMSMCDRAEYNTDAGNVNTVAFVNDWEDREYDPAAYALTTVWHNTRTGEIYDADIEINEQRGAYGICPPVDGCSDGTIDLQNVLTHEAGHFFGLGHTQPEHAFAVMYAVSPPGEVGKRVLRTDDIEGFCSIYPAGSLPDSCSFTPRHGLDLSCDGDDGCGCSAPGAGDDARSPKLVLALLAAMVLVIRRTRRR
jgi:MYXO-CTERM domain-containing protein